MKVSMKNWRQNKMKPFWLHSLLRIYTLVMIAIIASFAVMLSYADWSSREKEAQRVAQRVTTRTVSEIEYYHRESTQLAQTLVENQARIEGIYKYFSLSTPDYFYWQLERKASPYISVSLYENIDDLYVRNDFVTGVAIVLQDYKKSLFLPEGNEVERKFQQKISNQLPIVLPFLYPIPFLTRI